MIMITSMCPSQAKPDTQVEDKMYLLSKHYWFDPTSKPDY